ncbi:MAG: sugar phosphate nucleotidyltransferase, partial [bacterium]|nr:sugar phosphate nucleotidyltransferase [bacterium]
MKYIPFPVVILAGGLATRLHAITKNLPKSLILINNTPFIDHQLHLLNKRGLKEVILCLGHFGEQIQSYLGKGTRYGLNIQYVH